MMIPSPSIKLDHGNVLTNIPTLPRRVGTKLISAEAVPISVLTILRSTSMVKGRTMDSIIAVSYTHLDVYKRQASDNV